MKKYIHTALFMCLLSLCLPTVVTLGLSRMSDHDSPYTFQSGIFIYINEGSQSIRLDMDEYLLHCVYGALPANYTEEMMKVMAVIERTLILRTLGERTFMDASELNRSFISTNVMQSQLKSDYDTVYGQIYNAITATAGEALYYEDELILPLYFQCSNGHTRNMSDVFGTSLPYLISVDSAMDSSAPDFESEKSIASESFIGILQSHNRNFYAEPLSLPSSIQITELDSAGYVKSIQAGNITTTGDAIQNLFDLPSASFSVVTSKDTITFKTRGSGHGVGLSQYGANTMSLEGKTYKDILAYYYPGTTIR